MTFLCTAICSIINTGHGDYTILATGREYLTSDSDHGKPIHDFIRGTQRSCNTIGV